MRRILPAALAALFVTALTATLALAGGDAGLPCPNACPLAKSANALRTNGAEGVRACKSVSQDVRREILDALDRV